MDSIQINKEFRDVWNALDKLTNQVIDLTLKINERMNDLENHVLTIQKSVIQIQEILLNEEGQTNGEE